MRRILAPAALLALGLLAPAAAAPDTPSVPALSVPTVTVPTVTVPTVTVPTVTVPTATVPPVTTPVVTTPPVTSPTATVPSVHVPPPPVTTPPLPKPSARAPSAPSTGANPAPAQPSATANPSSAQPGSGRYSQSPGAPLDAYTSRGAAPPRSAHAGRAPRPTVARFRLEKPTRVRVTVWQEAPRCRRIGRYTYVGERGRNVLRLPRRIGSRLVTSGTYRLVAVAVHREILDVRVRVVRKGRTLQVRRDGLEDACTQTIEATGLLGTAVFGGNAGVFSAGGRTGGVQGANATRSHERGGVLSASRPNASPFSPKALLGAKSVTVRTLLFVLLGLAAALLAAGSLPASGAGATPVAAIARHRAAVTSAGFAMIVAAVLAALLT